MADEQEVTMSASVRTIRGIGPQAVEVFESAGFVTIGQLRAFDNDDARLWDAIQRIKATKGVVEHLPSYWKRLLTRCVNVAYRVRSAEATDFVPDEYMCPISLEWFEDPVVVASGQSYSRRWLEEHLQHSRYDPLTRIEIAGKAVYSNVALRNAVDHYRMNFQRFRILS